MEEVKLPGWLAEGPLVPPRPGGGRGGAGFLEKNLRGVATLGGASFDGFFDTGGASRKGLLQAIEPRARVAGVLLIAVAGVAAGRASVLFSILFLTVLLALLSGVGISSLARKVLPAFIFTSFVALPAFFEFFTPGTPLLAAPVAGFSITEEGLAGGLFFILRVVSIAAVLGVLLLTTREVDFLRGLRGLPVPSIFITSLYMTFRYVFLLLRLVEEATLARKSRTVDRKRLRESRRWFATRVALFLERAVHTAGEVSLAMASRGLGARLKVMAPDPLRAGDYLFLGFSFFVLFLCLSG